MMTRNKQLLIYKILALVFIVLLFLTSSIDPSPDMDMRVIATSVGLDYSIDSVNVCAQLISPIAEGGGNSMTSVAEGSGKTLAEAISNMSVALGKKIEYEQCSMVVVGNTLAKMGVYEPLSYLIASGLVRTGTNLLYSANATAKEFIEGVTELNKNSSIGLNEFLMYSRDDTNISTVSILDFMSNSQSESRAAYIPCLEFVKNDASENQSVAPCGKIEKGNMIAVFSNCSLAKTLTLDESRGIIWLDKNIKKGDTTLENFSYDGVSYAAIPIEVESKTVRYASSLKGGKPSLKIKVKAKMRITDRHLLDKTTTNIDFSKAIEKAFEDKIICEIGECVSLAKRYNIDFLKIKTQFHRYNLAELRKNKLTIDDVFSELATEYLIDCNIK